MNELKETTSVPDMELSGELSEGHRGNKTVGVVEVPLRHHFEQVLTFPPISKASLSTYCPEMIKKMLVEEFLSIADDDVKIMESYVEAHEEYKRCKKEPEGTKTERTDFENDFIPENY